MLACAEEVLEKLDLHYRVVTSCTGDMGSPRRKPMTSKTGCRARMRTAKFRRVRHAVSSRRAG